MESVFVKFDMFEKACSSSSLLQIFDFFLGCCNRFVTFMHSSTNVFMFYFVLFLVKYSIVSSYVLIKNI